MPFIGAAIPPFSVRVSEPSPVREALAGGMPLLLRALHIVRELKQLGGVFLGWGGGGCVAPEVVAGPEARQGGCEGGSPHCKKRFPTRLSQEKSRENREKYHKKYRFGIQKHLF